MLVDFGDGSYRWAGVSLGNNRTAFNATVTASAQLDLSIEYRWFSFGVMVNDIGDRNPVYPVWWHLYIWNRTGGIWGLSSVGASDLTLENGDAIAWYLAIDGPSSSPVPSPTPSSPHPQLSFRGDISNSGRYPGTLCDMYSAGWEYDTGSFEISGTPAEYHGTLFVPTWTGLFALDVKSGGLVWKRDDIRGMSSPAVFDGGLFIGAKDGKLHYVSASTGAEIWNKSLLPSPVFTGIASSPKPYLDKVYVGLFEENGAMGGVVALNIWNGSYVWQHSSPSVHMSSPAISGSTLYIGVAGRFNGSSNSFAAPYGLLALNASSGSERWFFPTGGPVLSSPMILDSLVLFTSRDGILHALRPDGTQAWRQTIGPSTSSPATDGTSIFVGHGVLGSNGGVIAFSSTNETLWRKDLTGPVQTSPLYADGVIFVGTNEAHGTFYALDATNGDVLWDFTPSPGDYILSQPIVADGDVYLSSDNGIVYQFECHQTGEGWGPGAYAAFVAAALGTVAAIEGIVLIRRRKRK